MKVNLKKHQIEFLKNAEYKAAVKSGSGVAYKNGRCCESN